MESKQLYRLGSNQYNLMAPENQSLDKNQQFFPVRVAVIPPLVTGEDPGATPRIQAVSAVVSPNPAARAIEQALQHQQRLCPPVANFQLQGDGESRRGWPWLPSYSSQRGWSR